jgi:hypothetical protein
VGLKNEERRTYSMPRLIVGIEYVLLSSFFNPTHPGGSF